MGKHYREGAPPIAGKTNMKSKWFRPIGGRVLHLEVGTTQRDRLGLSKTITACGKQFFDSKGPYHTYAYGKNTQEQCKKCLKADKK